MNIKRFLMLALVVVPLTSIAQVKIAIVDVQAIFNDMPEAKQANELLNTTSQKFKAEYEMMQKEFNKKYAAFQSLVASDDTPETIRDRRIREIQDSDSKIGAFLEQTNTLLLKQKQELEKPIYDKIAQAIKTVGDEGGYTYIIDVSKTPVAYSGPQAIDVTSAVRKLLGLN